MRLASENQMPREGLGPQEHRKAFLGGAGVRAVPVVYFSYFATKSISLCQVGLILLVCHFAFIIIKSVLKQQTHEVGRGRGVIVLYKVTVCVF